jgi:FMN phosphatase YigB (HAD superfamily)
MRPVIIAFDIDGTLRNNKKEYARGSTGGVVWNDRICQMAVILSKMKNTRMIIWSGGGNKYAEYMRDKFNEEFGKTFGSAYAKFDSNAPIPDIAFDDIQECILGKVNIIVRGK